MPVTAGSISIARRINTGDYSHKEAKVELHYTVEGDEDIKVLGAQAAHAALIHLAQVLATVVKIDHTPEIHVEAPEVGPDMSDESEAGRSIANAPKRHRRTKAEMQAAQAAVNLVGDADPMTLFPAEATDDIAATSQPVDPTNFTAEPISEITDKELNNVCNETMLRIKNKQKIQSVIGEYTHGPVSTIPQLVRAMFLQKLKALEI